MWWQQYVADVAFELDVDGSLYYREIVLTVPRQAGKTSLLLPVFVHRCVAPWPGGIVQQGHHPQSVLYTAQSRNDARKKFIDDFIPALLGSGFRNDYSLRMTNGSEGFTFANGSTFDLMATTLKSGHGPTNDLAMLDESFAHPDNRLEQAVTPAQSTRRSPQRWITSTAGESAKGSPFLWSKVELGRELVTNGGPGRTAYFEWSLSDDEDPTEPANWWKRHPALGFTITEATIQDALASMSPSDFARAYANQWGSSRAAGHIPLDWWDNCGDPAAAPGDPIALAVDVSPDRSTSAISVCGDWNGRPCVELIDYRPGVDWLPDRLAELSGRWNATGVALDAGSAAGSLAGEIEARGLKVSRLTNRDVVHAAGQFFDLVGSKTLAHSGQSEMRVGIAGAAKQDVGDSWKFARRLSTIDISPITSASFALWLHQQKNETPVMAPFLMVVGGTK